MKLQNPFPQETREIFRDVQYFCFICGKNGSDVGGTELHHILGRVSNSAFNAAVLCKKCHYHIKHSKEEHKFLLNKTARYVAKKIKQYEYRPRREDFEFVDKYSEYYDDLSWSDIILTLNLPK